MNQIQLKGIKTRVAGKYNQSTTKSIFLELNRTLSDDQNTLIAAIEEKAQKLDNLLDDFGSDPDMKIARERLMESTMWAVSNIVND